MQKTLLFIITLFFITCDSPNTSNDSENMSWVFVANEGDLGASNGSISMIDDDGNVSETHALGEIVQSVEVYNDKLIVLINGGQNQSPEDSKIKIFDITSNGLSMPGIEIFTDNSSPREMVVIEGMLYFTNWNTQDIKIFNLFNYTIESSIPVDGLPEDIIADANNLWVTINMNSDWTPGNKIVKIDINTNAVSEIIEVEDGPLELTKYDGDIYISRTYYDENWNASQGVSSIKNGNVMNKNYGSGGACGGSILNYNNHVYRSFEGGIAPVDSDLNLDLGSKIGNFENEIYHAEIIENNIWFALTDKEDYNEIKVIDLNGNELATYSVGKFPGDFAIWNQDNN